MRTLLSALVLLAPALAFGQVRVEFGLPTIHFDIAPPVVVVRPGVQVVEEQEDEVFVVDHVYWCRREGRWYRSYNYRGRWVYVEERRVPQRLVIIPRGKYRNYKHVEREEKEWRNHERHGDERHGYDRRVEERHGYDRRGEERHGDERHGEEHRGEHHRGGKHRED
jgi:hypothetical protein